MKYPSTLLAQNNSPQEIQKADLDLLKKINSVQDAVDAISSPTITTSSSSSTTSYEDDFRIKRVVTNNMHFGHIFETYSGKYVASAGATSTANLSLGITDIAGTNIGMSFISFPQDEKGKIVDIGGNMAYSWALFDSGNLYMCGRNDQGQFGLGNTTSINIFTLVNTNVVKMAKIIYTGIYQYLYATMIILKTDGKWYGAGYNGGALGLGDSAIKTTWTPLPGIVDAREVWLIGSSNAYTIYQKNSGEIFVAGYNASGNLGVNSTAVALSFVDATTAWGGLSAGNIETAYGACLYYNTALNNGAWVVLLRRDSTGRTRIFTCGNNTYGQIGNGLTAQIQIPYEVKFTGSTNIKSVHTMASLVGSIGCLTYDNKVWRWGRNTEGQWGNNTIIDILSPYNSGVSTNIDNNCKQIAHDYWDTYTYGYTCSIFLQHTDNTWWSCGPNGQGQLCNGTNTASTVFILSRIPKDVKIIRQIGYGNNTWGFYGVTENGTLLGWGSGQGNVFSMFSTASQNMPRIIGIKTY